MGTVIRPELSVKNKYWIDRHRYYELKHFCLQYPLWKKRYSELSDSTQGTRLTLDSVNRNSGVSKPVERCAELSLYFSDRIDMIERVAKTTDPLIGDYILKAVTAGVSYTYLKTKLNIPCGKDIYYELYRRFFYLLDVERG